VVTGIAINGQSKTFEKVESLVYWPRVQDSGDLAVTRVITATVEASGLANADYSTTLKLPMPDDTRIVVKRVAARLAIGAGAIIGSPNLRCRVYVDVQDAAHMLFDSNVGAEVNYVEAMDTTSGDIFDLITDGASHTYYFFIWDPNYSAGVNEYTINRAQLWVGVGSCQTVAGKALVLTLTHHGVVHFGGNPARRVGTGSATIFVSPTPDKIPGQGELFATPDHNIMLFSGTHQFDLYVTEPTDLEYMRLLVANLRSKR